MLREHSGTDESLEDAQCTEPKAGTKDREKAVEEDSGPADFRHDQDGHLEDDEQAIHDGPEDPAELVRHRAVVDVVTVDEGLGDIEALLARLVGVDGLDVGDDDEDAAGEDEKKRDDAQHTGDVEAEKDVAVKRRRHCTGCFDEGKARIEMNDEVAQHQKIARRG